MAVTCTPTPVRYAVSISFTYVESIFFFARQFTGNCNAALCKVKPKAMRENYCRTGVMANCWDTERRMQRNCIPIHVLFTISHHSTWTVWYNLKGRKLMVKMQICVLLAFICIKCGINLNFTPTCNFLLPFELHWWNAANSPKPPLGGITTFVVGSADGSVQELWQTAMDGLSFLWLLPGVRPGLRIVLVGMGGLKNSSTPRTAPWCRQTGRLTAGRTRLWKIALVLLAASHFPSRIECSIPMSVPERTGRIDEKIRLPGSHGTSERVFIVSCLVLCVAWYALFCSLFSTCWSYFSHILCNDKCLQIGSNLPNPLARAKWKRTGCSVLRPK